MVGPASASGGERSTMTSIQTESASAETPDRDQTEGCSTPQPSSLASSPGPTGNVGESAI